MRIIAISVKDAEAFLARFDRHYKTPAEPICAVGVGDDTGLHGAAIMGRNDAGEGELAHIYADGASQCYTLLYGAVFRTMKALGYRVMVL